ncbi:MAG TPA: YciI family protein, partial [Thermoanaerobaculia bacterium]
MRFLCLIYLDEEKLNALPAPEMDALNAAHLDLNDELRASGHFIEAEALQPVGTTATVRVRQGKVSV